jgi:NRPS condensation-like uncharacterized protein
VCSGVGLVKVWDKAHTPCDGTGYTKLLCTTFAKYTPQYRPRSNTTEKTTQNEQNTAVSSQAQGTVVDDTGAQQAIAVALPLVEPVKTSADNNSSSNSSNNDNVVVHAAAVAV